MLFSRKFLQLIKSEVTTYGKRKNYSDDFKKKIVGLYNSRKSRAEL